ncbi:MAG: hypothetical protein MUC92_00565 [Fimbriimonadaceae bacterium]|jgi:hypothetical protein|nr:hypothetical protein [Fimbriimonadaceae bacterium]
MRLFFASFAALALWGGAFAQGQPTYGLNSFAFTGVTNDTGGTFGPVHTLNSDFSETGGFVSQTGSGAFQGLNSNGDSSTLVFSGQSSASASYGRLRARARGELSNPFYNSANEPYLIPDPGGSGNLVVNPNGTPDRFLSVGQAQFFDKFNYGGDFSNVSGTVKVDFWYRVSGQLSGDQSYISLLVRNDDDSDAFLRQSNGSTTIVNEIWTTKKFVIGADRSLNHILTLISQFDSGSTLYLPEGQDVVGSAEFQNTVTLERMNLYDGNDNLITGWTVTGDSGTDYSSAVPEPMTMTVLAGLGMIVARRRRAKKA